MTNSAGGGARVRKPKEWYFVMISYDPRVAPRGDGLPVSTRPVSNLARQQTKDRSERRGRWEQRVVTPKVKTSLARSRRDSRERPAIDSASGGVEASASCAIGRSTKEQPAIDGRDSRCVLAWYKGASRRNQGDQETVDAGENPVRWQPVSGEPFAGARMGTAHAAVRSAARPGQGVSSSCPGLIFIGGAA